MKTNEPSGKRARRRPCSKSIEIFRRHHLLGQTQREVAKAMDCSAPRVHQICRYVLAWMEEQSVDCGQAAAREQQFLTLKWMLAEALKAWERSKRPLKTTKAKIVHGRVNRAGEALPDLVTSEQIEREQCGDPRYLCVAETLLKPQRTMAGIDDPTRSPDAGPLGISGLLQAVADHLATRPARSPAEKPSNVFDTDEVVAQMAQFAEATQGQEPEAERAPSAAFA